MPTKGDTETVLSFIAVLKAQAQGPACGVVADFVLRRQVVIEVVQTAVRVVGVFRILGDNVVRVEEEAMDEDNDGLIGPEFSSMGVYFGVEMGTKSLEIGISCWDFLGKGTDSAGFV